jgi:hypothetical protein
MLVSHLKKCHVVTQLLSVCLQNDDAAVTLTEIRFHIPGSELAGEDPVEAFRDQVTEPNLNALIKV